MINKIHQTDSERSNSLSEAQLRAIEENNRKSDEAIRASKETADAVRKLNDSLNASLEAQGARSVGSSDKSTSKLEEIKSAHLITNKLLKDLKDKEPAKLELTNVTYKDEKPNELATAFFSMLRGEKGETGSAGRDGKDCTTPKNGKDGKQGPPGKDGKSITGPAGPAGKDGTEIEPDEIIERINKALKKIDPKQVRGLADAMRQIEAYGTNPSGYDSGGANQLTFQDEGTRISDHVTTLNFVGAGVNATYSGNGVVTISVSGVSTVYSETPTGVVDGANVTYTILHDITTVYVFSINGQTIHPAEYSTAGSTITMVTALPVELSGLPFTIVYS